MFMRFMSAAMFTKIADAGNFVVISLSRAAPLRGAAPEHVTYLQRETWTAKLFRKDLTQSGTLRVDVHGWGEKNRYNGSRNRRSSSSAPATYVILPKPRRNWPNR